MTYKHSKHLINLSNKLYNIEGILLHLLFSSHMISELQNSSSLDLIFTSRGGVPTSPYTIFEHVNLFTFNIYFKNLNCNFSIISMFSLPHTSQPYVIMGTTIWLNGEEHQELKINT